MKNTESAVVTNIFLGNGGGVHSRVWIQSESGSSNFDVVNIEEARKYTPGNYDQGR
jgi:hypothetical protein